MEIDFGKLLPGDIFRLPDGTWWVKLNNGGFAAPIAYNINLITNNVKVRKVEI